MELSHWKDVPYNSYPGDTMDSNFLDFISNPEIRADINEWLKPTNDILSQIKDFTEDTVLENAVFQAEQLSHNKLVLQYFLTEELTEDEANALIEKKNMILSIDLPFKIEVEIYEPRPLPVLTLRDD